MPETPGRGIVRRRGADLLPAFRQRRRGGRHRIRAGAGGGPHRQRTARHLHAVESRADGTPGRRLAQAAREGDAPAAGAEGDGAAGQHRPPARPRALPSMGVADDLHDEGSIARPAPAGARKEGLLAVADVDDAGVDARHPAQHPGCVQVAEAARARVPLDEERRRHAVRHRRRADAVGLASISSSSLIASPAPSPVTPLIARPRRPARAAGRGRSAARGSRAGAGPPRWSRSRP